MASEAPWINLVPRLLSADRFTITKSETYSLAFEYQIVHLRALARNCLYANIDLDVGICSAFIKKQQGENASKLPVLYEISFTLARRMKSYFICRNYPKP